MFTIQCCSISFGVQYYIYSRFKEGVEKHFSDDQDSRNFDSYSLSNVYNILKSHEVEVKEIIDEKDKTTFWGPLARVSKTNVNKACFDVEDSKDKEGLIVNSDDNIVAYYSNNNFKKYYKSQ